MRGKPVADLLNVINEGITPAGAGKTVFKLFSPTVRPDHPRRCGENCRCRWDACGGAGSPPQVRGKPGRVCYKSENRRITPAGAGKTFSKYVASLSSTDHPRRCGENMFHAQMADYFDGSPPRMRGKPVHAIAAFTIRRITPADAGKTLKDFFPFAQC